jgi:hypothetical protein
MPAVMVHRRPRDWTKDEAGAFYRWFIAIKPLRIAEILRISGHSSASADVTSLQPISELLARSMPNLIVSTPDGEAVNGLGIVAGFDAALVIGEILTKSVSGASWKTMQTPIRDLISKNLPVVRKGTKGPGFEPFMEGRLLLSLIGRSPQFVPSNVLDIVYRKWHDTFSR